MNPVMRITEWLNIWRMKHGLEKSWSIFKPCRKNVLSLNHLVVQTKFLGSTVNPEMSIVGISKIAKANTKGELWSWNMISFGQLSCLSNFMFFPTYKLNCQDKRKKFSNNIKDEKLIEKTFKPGKFKKKLKHYFSVCTLISA